VVKVVDGKFRNDLALETAAFTDAPLVVGLSALADRQAFGDDQRRLVARRWRLVADSDGNTGVRIESR
jgi:hypothetical protein